MKNVTLMLSYPRCGSSYVKYFLQKCIGTDKVFDSKYSSAKNKKRKVDYNYLNAEIAKGNTIFKEHYSENCWDFDPGSVGLVFMIRNYKECIPRHIGLRAMGKMKVLEHCSKYLANLRFYDSWSGKKCILYYEDIIDNFKSNFDKILKIIDVNDKLYKEVFDKEEYHRKAVLAIYDRICGSQTKGQHKIYHSKKISKESSDLIDSFFKKDKLIKNRYLKRYL